MLDVSTVAARLLVNLSPAVRIRFEGLFGGAEWTLSWTSFLAALHDLGKASPAFQLYPRFSKTDKQAIGRRLCEDGFPLPRYPPRDLIRHGTIGARVLPGILAGYGFTSEAAESYARIVAGHHGAIPKRAEITAPQVGPDACGSGEWVRSRQEIVDALAGLSGIARASPPRAPSGPEAMALAGMISVADWIGSMKQSFPFAATDGALPDPFDFDGYAVAAAANAEIAVKELRWVNHAVRDAPKDFKSLFPSIAEPNDLQCVAEQVGEALDGPTLVIIEAPMGEGKTEAALYLAEAAATRLGQTGLYFALPTQATSNQMFSRVREFLTRVLGGEINLQLLHGHADLSAEFQDLREAGARSFTPIYDEYGNPSTTVVAAEWFTYRKRGLLAPFGVGTVDQALMAVLRARHFFVRMFGLGGKTIVIDEVHAYDVYMSTLMERLLEWLAASGSSVFLLSATLPSGRREALTSAYMRGLGVAPQSDTRAVYPRITYASARGSGEIEVTPSARIRRTLGIRWLGHAADLGAHLRGLLAEGGCAAVICNTVERAQDVYSSLKRTFAGVASDGEAELMLFHARFPFEERALREKLALIRFGKPKAKVEVGHGNTREVSRPQRAIIVATQVIEQSLDLDFDAMISEFAPADLLLQRAGRLHRHQRFMRPAPLSNPVLDVMKAEIGDDGIPDFGRGTKAIYDSHVLLRSWAILRDREAIEIPESVEEMIEAVYAQTIECPVTASASLRDYWNASALEHQESLEKDSRTAKITRIPAPFDEALFECGADFEEDNPEIHAGLQARTRLSEGPSVDVVLLEALDAASFDPDATPNRARAHFLLKRSVKISHAGVARALLNDGQSQPHGWERSALLRHHRVAKLDEHGTVVIDPGRYQLTLDSELGVLIGRLDSGGS
jgi:CRISPR-associated endonuclease/helicase Cas3